MRLYYHPLSSNSRRVLLTAHRLGISLDLVPLDLTRGAHKAPDYLRLNPAGRVPLLVDGDFLLWESHAIMQYLADTVPEQDIYPAAIQERADVNRWLFWSAFHFAPTAACLIRERVSKRVLGGTPDSAEIARGDALLPPAMQLLDDQLAGREWIAQDRLTLADFAVVAPLMHAAAAAIPMVDFANVSAWFDRVQALPAWKATAP